MHQRNTVILAGSGRSGTTWLGSILDTYEGADYFFEVEHFAGLDFDSPDLLRAKYPFIHFLNDSPAWIQRLEHGLLIAMRSMDVGRSLATRSLRIRYQFQPKTAAKNFNLFKSVRLLQVALRYPELKSKYGQQLRLAHLIRNPFAQFASTSKMKQRGKVNTANAFRGEIDLVLSTPRLSKYHALARSYRDSSWAEKSALIWWIANEMLVDQMDENKTIVVYEALTREPLVETSRIFDFLGWPLSAQTRDYIRETTDAKRSEGGQFSVHKSASDGLTSWTRDLTSEDYEKMSQLLRDCRLMRLWSEDELALRR